jgi:hypothetical protein
MSNTDKLNKMEELKKRKLQLEAMLMRTMNEIKSFDVLGHQNGIAYHV